MCREEREKDREKNNNKKTEITDVPCEFKAEFNTQVRAAGLFWTLH